MDNNNYNGNKRYDDDDDGNNNMVKRTYVFSDIFFSCMLPYFLYIHHFHIVWIVLFSVGLD